MIQLTGQLPISDIELEEGVAGHQRHIVEFPHIPSTDQDASAGWICLDEIDGLRDLVDDAPILRLPLPPLFPIDGAEISFFVGPLIPDPHLVFLQVANIRISGQEPQQLMDDARPMQPLGGHCRKSFGKVEPHLVAED